MSVPPNPRARRTAAGEPEPAPSLWSALRGIGARRELEELLDRPEVDRRTLAGNLRDLRLLNHWLGWSRTVGRTVEELMRGRGLRDVTLLDVATGSADIPHAVTASATRHGLTIRIIASDVSAAVLAEARLAHLQARPASIDLDAVRAPSPHRLRRLADRVFPTTPRTLPIDLVQHDATRLPFRDGSFDIATLCLAAHHFDPETLVHVLGELRRVARHGVIVSDLVRGPVDYLLARLMAVVLRNRLTAHDGPVSVLRAYTPAELRALARRAGLTRTRVRRSFPARMTLVARCD